MGVFEDMHAKIGGRNSPVHCAICGTIHTRMSPCNQEGLHKYNQRLREEMAKAKLEALEKEKRLIEIRDYIDTSKDEKVCVWLKEYLEILDPPKKDFFGRVKDKIK